MWEDTSVTVSEGDDGEETDVNICITLENKPGIILRELNFLLTTVTGSAGELLTCPCSSVAIQIGYWLRCYIIIQNHCVY